MTTPLASALTWKHFPAGPNGFFRAPVLITGPTEAVLIDGGFKLADGRVLVEAIKTARKRLTTIYISQSDPDYCFSLGPVRDPRHHSTVLPGDKNGSLQGTRPHGLSSQPRP